MKTSLTGSCQVSFLCNGRVFKLNTIVFDPTKNAESSCWLAGFCLETFPRIITWINNEDFWSTVNFLLISLSVWRCAERMRNNNSRHAPSFMSVKEISRQTRHLHYQRITVFLVKEAASLICLFPRLLLLGVRKMLKSLNRIM